MTACGSARRGLPAALLLLQLLGFFHTSSSVPFEVKDESGKICVMAELSANFSVIYEATGSKSEISHFILPGDALLHNSSTCGKNGSDQLLAVAFGSQHIMTIIFSRNALEYNVVRLNFSYNLSDTTYFPNSTVKGTVAVSSKNPDIAASINTTYRCFHEEQITMENVSVILYDIKMEAYLPKNNFSDKETLCKKDVPSTTPMPTTSPTTAKPTTPPTPAVGTYNVSDVNGTCLLISSGVQLNITYSSKSNKTALDVFALDPTQLTYNGSCTPSPTIILTFKQTTLALNFFKNESANVFYLRSVSVNTTLPSDAKDLTFSVANETVSYLKATVGKSYKCNAKQTLQITKEFSINTFNLQVQAYKVDGDKFGAVEECQLDENNMLVPIIVGAALAGLVLIVLVAYLIGRKRSHAGYQTI